MNLQRISIFLIIFLILITITAGVMKPALHKKVQIDDADFAFVEEPVVQTPASPVTPASKSMSLPQNNPAPVEKEQPAIQKNVPSVQPQPASMPKPQQPPALPVPKAKPVPKKVTPPVNNAPQELTEAEEIIVWNKWRSELQNQVMKDTSIGAPLGTGFKFSFTVDKFGNISNLKVWSTSPAFTSEAVRVIKPIIQSYQGQPILSFPQGTKRMITNVTGGFRISTRTGYSSPSDYSDVERVKN